MGGAVVNKIDVDLGVSTGGREGGGDQVSKHAAVRISLVHERTPIWRNDFLMMRKLHG